MPIDAAAVWEVKIIETAKRFLKVTPPKDTQDRGVY